MLFGKPPGIFHFLTLTLEIPDKTMLNPWIFNKIVLRSLGNLKSKKKDPWKLHLIFIGHRWKFHFAFN